MDFYKIVVIQKKDGSLQLRPDWKVGRSKDLMTRGGSFYAIWDEAAGLWSTDIYDVQRLVDADLVRAAEEMEAKSGATYTVARLEDNSTKLWDQFQHFMRNSGNNFHDLDEKLVFADTEVKKEDYASRRLDYSLKKGKCDAWNTLVGTLYNDEERAKIEWAIGAVVSGDSKFIQKFLVFYGPPGSGKSTILNIIQMLFNGYIAVFDARELAGSNNAFATTAFKSNPLVAIQHDGDLSRIVDNTKLNSIVAHETMTVNEKYKAPFDTKLNAFLFMGTNLPVKISDAKAGIIRRLIDVVPTQKTFENDYYHTLMGQIPFELGAIAHHCLQRYYSMGRNFYSSYRPTEMMLQTDVFYNFVEACFDIFKAEDAVSLRKAWALYKEYCADTGIDKILPQYKFREELKNYFFIFEERTRVDGVNIRSYYRGFKNLSPSADFPIKSEGTYEIVLEEGISVFDEAYPGLSAQYAKEDGSPRAPWAKVRTVLSDLDTSQLHYVKIPENHIVIDFDIRNEDGEKDFSKNLEEAQKWPATYTEISQGGQGIHLHYIYTGDVRELKADYSPGIEVKTLLGDAALRRRLTKSNDQGIAHIHSGLPKKEKKVLDVQRIQSEKGLRNLIARTMQKEFGAGTKPAINFIKHILDEAYEDKLAYDVSDMHGDILTFALKSTNHSDYCVKTVQQMKFVGQEPMPEIDAPADEPITFFDVEVYPNLLVVCYKEQGNDEVIRLINPNSDDIGFLLKKKLVGFNNRRYDNHVLYARLLGRSLEAIFDLSFNGLTGNNRNAYFGEAYNLSYADIYDFMSEKKGLKKCMIELGIYHLELDLPYDKPVPEHEWKRVVDYCANDVVATEKVFEDRYQDFVARQILADLSGLKVNQTTQTHTAKIIFGNNKEPQSSFIYTDLSIEFPGYEFDGRESHYLGEITGEGGYVYAEPGIYENVALLDVASMHPRSIEMLNLFGHYTERYSALIEARLAIKRKDFARARNLLDGKLGKYLGDDKDADALAYALKIVINTVYGLTSASFPNPFRDMRNKDNIVAKRGALFMVKLKHALQEMGVQVVHIKTDSIKIPNASPEIIRDVKQFGAQYGYEFEHEETYDWMCLANDAVYVAKKTHQEAGGCREEYKAVGAQFQHPYVFKKLFSKEEVIFQDYCETKNVVKGTMYLDFSESEDLENMIHVGKTGSFVPVIEDGGVLWRLLEDKKYAVAGTKGYRWITRDMAIDRGIISELSVDLSYFDNLLQNAIGVISKFNPELDEFQALSYNGLDPSTIPMGGA